MTHVSHDVAAALTGRCCCLCSFLCRVAILIFLIFCFERGWLPSLKPLRNLLCTILRYRIRPVPVVFRLLAFSLQLTEEEEKEREREGGRERERERGRGREGEREGGREGERGERNIRRYNRRHTNMTRTKNKT